jgi:hypothetical protein
MRSKTVKAGLNTPLRKIGELPDVLFMSCIEGLAPQLAEPLKSSWHAQRAQIQLRSQH